MPIKQYHGIKVGDLVRFKHHIFDEFKPIHLVAEVFGCINTMSHGKVPYIRLNNNPINQRHRADDFVIVSRS